MAAYDYTSTYYTTYFQFNQDSDTGTAQESVRPFPVTSADTGHCTDAAGSISFFFSDSDTGSGTDANSPPKVKPLPDGSNAAETAAPGPQSADVSAPAADNGGITGGLFTVADADSGSAAEALARAGLTDGDFTNALEIDLIADFDTASGAEAQVLGPVSADTASGVEASATGVHPATDTAQGNEGLGAFGIVASATDPAAGADTEAQPAIPLSSADTGAGADAVGSIFPAITGADTGAGIETQVLAAALSSADSASAFDVSNVRPDADAGSSADAGRVGVSSADTGSAAETSPIPNAHSTDSDAAQGIDGGSVNTPNKFDVDAAHGAEGTPALLVRTSSADTWHAVFEGTAIDNADIVFGTEEVFSLVRAAVLTPGSGIEQLQLPGVRDGSMSPEFTAVSSMADDVELATWAQLNTVAVTVSGGFLSFPALSLLLGGTVSSDSNNRLSVPWGRISLPAAAEVPLVLRASSRDSRGRPRTLDFVLYRVRFTSLTVESFAYKNGVVASWTAQALFSTFDESGAPLSDDGTEQGIGRLVSSPGALPSPIPGLFNGRHPGVTRLSSSDAFSALDGKVNVLPTAVSSSDTASAIDSTGQVRVGTSGSDSATASELGAVTSATASSADTGTMLDGKPLVTVLLINSADAASGTESPGSVLVGGAAKSDVEVFHAVEGAVAEIDVSSSDTGTVTTAGQGQNVNPIGSNANISDGDSMFNNEHPATGEQGTYIQINPVGGATTVAATVGFRAPPGTWSTVNSQIGPGGAQRVFYSGALPAGGWGGSGGEAEPPQDGSVTIIISYKTQGTQAAMNAFIQSIPNAIPVWMIYHHEPEGDYTTNGHGAQFVSEFVSEMAKVATAKATRADNGAKIKRVFCSAGSPYPKNLDSCQDGSYIPPIASADYYMFDYYPGLTATSTVAAFTITKQTRWSLWLAALDNANTNIRLNRPLGFTEYGLNQCATNTVRAGILAADCNVFRQQFPAQGTTFGGALGPGTTTAKVSKFPMQLWEYWDMNQGTTCAVMETLDDGGTGSTRATWKQIANGTI